MSWRTHSNQRDLEQRQLSAPAFVPTKAFSTANKPNSVTNETNASCATSGEDSCASSVRACNAIFALQSTTVAQIPTAQRMRDEQERDASLQKWIKHHTLSSSQFAPQLTECENGTQVWADVTATYTRILVPTSLQRSIFDSLHSLSHPGVKAGMALLNRVYWWSGIGKDVSKWTRLCEACQKAKVQTHTKTALSRLPAPTKRFSHVHIDLVSPLNPACEEKNTLLTVIDRWTGWPEAFPMTMHGDAANSKACATMLVRQWIARWGVPDVITSDRGSQFVSDLWGEICQLMGITRDQTSSYHP